MLPPRNRERQLAHKSEVRIVKLAINRVALLKQLHLLSYGYGKLL